MRPAILLASIFLVASPFPTSAAKPVSMQPARQADPTRAKLQPYLAPSLRQWVREEGRRQAEAGPDVELATKAVEDRLAGQDYTAMDVNALVQWVLRESYLQTQEDLRAVAEEMKAVNEKKKAMREAAQGLHAGQAQKRVPRASLEHAMQVQPAPVASVNAASLQADVDDMQVQRDSTADHSEEISLRMQMYEDRRAQTLKMISNLQKKASETAAGITANLK